VCHISCDIIQVYPTADYIQGGFMTARFILKLCLYLNSITADLQKMNRYRGRAEVSAFMLVVILVLDLHRYGAWYSGNRAFLKPYAVPMLILLSMPLIIYASAVILRRFVMKGRYNLLTFCAVTVFLYCVIMFFCWPAFLPDSKDWLSANMAFVFDMKFLKTACIPLAPAAFFAYFIITERFKI
jgi:hypothetical protein